MTPQEIRLRLVEAAVAAGKQQPNEIMTFAEQLRSYVFGLPSAGTRREARPTAAANKVTSEEHRAEITRLWESNCSAERIAEAINSTAAHVYLLAQAWDLPSRDKKAVRAATREARGQPAVSSSKRRFEKHFEPNPQDVAPLREGHPALEEGRTIFPSMVVAPSESNRLLVSGANSRKLGDRITKGPWAGYPLYYLTLEERATCPTTCYHWATCYGNAMPFARRHQHGQELTERLAEEVVALAAQHPHGLAIRLHNLGDFWSVEYVKAWLDWLDTYPQLHVFGYTAWPIDSQIGAIIRGARDRNWPQFAIRFSSEKPLSGGATTIWTKPTTDRVPEGIVCPAQTNKTDCCGTCGLCWAPAAKQETIVFIAHGMKAYGRNGRPETPADIKANRRAAAAFPKDGKSDPALDTPSTYEGDSTLVVAVDRRCGCGTVFKTSLVHRDKCDACEKAGYRRNGISAAGAHV